MSTQKIETIEYKRPDSEKKYYNVEHLIKLIPDAKYYMIFNGRQNGKTYSILRHLLEVYQKTGRRGVIIRRRKETFEDGGGAQMFDDLEKNGEIADVTGGEWTGVYWRAGRWYLCKDDPKDPDGRIISREPFCFATALSNSGNKKGIATNNVGTIFFDEFISDTFYLANEFIIFTNTISTIVRTSDAAQIFIAGNTINTYNPYFREFGLKHAKYMKPGDIDTYKFKDSRGHVMKFVVERPEEAEGKKVSNVYFAFDNPALRMITEGGWQIQSFPHCPGRIAPKDIKFIYFIEFDEQLFQAEVIINAQNNYTYIHRKTTELKEPEKDLIYSQENRPGPNYARNLIKPVTVLQKKISWYYTADKVFYQDNEVGEAIFNYLNWCKNHYNV